MPEYRGGSVYEEAIENKETHWGVTLHLMDEHYDTGQIIKRVNIELHVPYFKRSTKKMPKNNKIF